MQSDSYLQKQTRSPTRGMLPGRGPGCGRGWRCAMFPLAFFRVKKKTRINRCGGEGCCLGPQVEDTEADSRFCAVLEPEALEPYRGGWREGLRAELWRGLCGEELGR